MRLIFGLLLLALLIGSSGGVYRTPFSFSDIQPPQIVMPELHSVNISHLNITFPEFEPEIGVSPVAIELEPEAEIEPEVESAPEPESPYDVRIYQQDNFIITEAAGEPIAALPIKSKFHENKD